MGDARHQGMIVLLLNGLARGKRKRPHGTAVKGPEEGQVQLPAGMPPGKFERCFNGFCARVAKIDFVQSRTRRQPGEFLGQQDLGRIIEVRTGHMQELIGLVFDGLYHEGVAVASGANRDARSEIKKTVAVRIADPEPFGRLRNQRVDARVRRRHEPVVDCDERRRARTRQRGYDLGILHDGFSLRGLGEEEPGNIEIDQYRYQVHARGHKGPRHECRIKAQKV